MPERQLTLSNGPPDIETEDLPHRVKELEEQVANLYQWIEVIGLGLEKHSSHSNPLNQFFMVPRPPNVDMVFTKIHTAQLDLIRPMVPKWLKELGTSSPEYLQLWDFICVKARYYHDNLEEYVSICVSRKTLEKEYNIRPEERKPSVDHLFHVGRIDIYSVRGTAKGLKIKLGEERGMEHRYGAPLERGLSMLIWNAFMRPPTGNIDTEKTEGGDTIYHLESHLHLQK